MRDLNNDQIRSNLQIFREGTGRNKGLLADARYASFDYCYNYFQSFREKGATQDLANEENLQHSCLQLGFYLASWGMMRGSSELLQKSARHLIHTVKLIANEEKFSWEIDIDRYDDSSMDRLLDLSDRIKQKIRGERDASETLSTKVMLGVFGNIPAYDTYFKEGFEVTTLGRKSLRLIRDFYNNHKGVFDEEKFSTIEFNSKIPSRRIYPKAKLMDMIFFIEGGKSQ